MVLTVYQYADVYGSVHRLTLYLHQEGLHYELVVIDLPNIFMYPFPIQGICSKIQLLQPTHHASTMFVKHAKARR